MIEALWDNPRLGDAVDHLLDLRVPQASVRMDLNCSVAPMPANDVGALVQKCEEHAVDPLSAGKAGMWTNRTPVAANLAGRFWKSTGPPTSCARASASRENPPKPPTPESTNAAPTLPRPQGTVVLADRGPQHTSWVFGHRLRSAGLLGSTGRVASSVDNALIESFWSTIQRELLDRHQWQSRSDFESLHDTAQPAA